MPRNYRFKMAQKCPVCSKSVYFAEELKAIGKTFHKLCLKCSKCNKLLDSTSVNDHDGSLFCRSCYSKNFGPKGYGFAAGGAGLSTEYGKSSQVRSGGGSAASTDGRPKFGGTEQCPRCKQAVYFAEEARALGKKFHKKCLVCNSCNKSLDSTTLTNHEDEIFCKSCYGKKFGPRGYGFAGGSSGLSMDTGRAGEVTQDNVSSLAKAQAVSMATNGDGPRVGGADACPRCNKPVYFAEERRALGKKYHKLCLCCTECKKQLDSTTLTNHDNHIYCKSCYGRLFGPRGYGFAQGGAGLSMDTGKAGEISRDNVSSYSKAQVVMDSKGDNGGGNKFGGADACPRCGKTVYFAEKIVGGGRSWHKMCFRCEDCNKALESTTLCEAGDKIVCKSCYGKTYGPKGFGFGALNATT
ncbi:muscle LIM protein Mlp84B-like isoform X1 [Haliotis rufescens]|uniref:muscle LIM protein Mlp84B-like isoform X1 n=2 Tax=Haliotis rufescens TaxID=6454 RepID=UPI00201EAA51|nr:muscle LIM protein Mlp84B-like isoform X1 [Haliotis rufescens]